MLVKVCVVVDGTLVVTVMVRVGPVFIMASVVGSVGLGSFLDFVFVFLALEMMTGVGRLLSSTLITTREVFVAVVLERIVVVLNAVDVIVSVILR